jgi:hypothetical protein
MLKGKLQFCLEISFIYEILGFYELSQLITIG